ncbi:hypothetical protein Scep_027036 [Stephania cephalantha]|uniref:Uncharacterized protein n=1 Tax=Stephania cephalantha TaxID=152367 RepID=A0AAP0ERJ1_9MAGN
MPCGAQDFKGLHWRHKSPIIPQIQPNHTRAASNLKSSPNLPQIQCNYSKSIASSPTTRQCMARALETL